MQFESFKSKVFQLVTHSIFIQISKMLNKLIKVSIFMVLY